MHYTIKQLAEASGVSTRTLRYYESIGLLSPAYYGDNGYRYYSEKELLQLQQILFFRELEIKLDDIKKIIHSNEFDQLKSLNAHKDHIHKKIQSLTSLTKTIDKTIAHLKGEIAMKEHELYIGFQHPKQIEMIDYLETTMGASARKIIDQAKENTKKMNLTPEDIKKHQDETNEWIEKFKSLISNNIPPTSIKTQELMRIYYEKRILRFCSPTADEFIQLLEAEARHPEYQKKFDAVHSDFSEYFLTAAKYFANKKLKS